jgi:PAS domain S-box-containing protein
MRLLINAVPALIWTARADGRLDFISQRWLDYAGVDTETIGSGELGERTVHPDDIEPLRNKWGVAVAEGKPFEAEIRVRRFDGEYRWFLSRACPLHDRSGHILGWYGNDIDIEDRKRAEEALRQSEAYLAEAQRLSHTGSWAGAPGTGEIRYWSEECYRVLGFDPQKERALFETFFQRIHPDDQARTVEQLESASREKREFEFDYRMIHPSGDIREIHTVGHPVFNPSGDLVEYVGTVIDVTERKRAEALHEGESHILEMIARDAPLGEILEKLVRLVEAQFAGLLCSVLLLDEDGQHVRHGAAPSLPEPYTKGIDGLCIGPKAGSCGTAMYRKKPVVVTDILQDPLWEPYRSVAAPHGLRACWSTPIVAHSGKTLGSFAMYYREPRSPSPAEARAQEMATHLASIAIERKRTQEQLQRSEAYLAEAQRLSHTGSWAFNAREALYWSEENFRIWGFNPQQGLPDRDTVLQRIHPEDRDKVVEYVQKAVREKIDYAVEFRIVLPDGTVKHIHGLGHPVFSASGELVEVVGTQLDLTERKRAEEGRERLRQLQADLAHINRVTTMGELTASLAHEVNQPIAAAVTDANTCLRWLTRDQPEVEEARQAASRIVKDATRAADIISRIRLLFKKDTPQRASVDLNEVIREMIALLRSEATRFSVSVRTELADLAQVMADRVQLQQVLMNLMINGIDAMRDIDGPRELIIRSQRADGQLMVSVTDTGVGLPPEQADQIFHAFFTTKPHGTGMGLRISRSIVESHGGRLWATDNSPRGASFHLTLPTKVEAHE